MSGCPHGMPSPGSCVDCMDEGLLPPPPRSTWTKVRTFNALYEGVCPCAEPIEKYQSITQWDQMEGTTVIRTAYTHRDCDPR